MDQNKIQTKKGIALNQAFGAVLTLVLIGILVIVAIFLFVNLGTTFDATVTDTTANESITAFSGTQNKTLLGAAACGFGTVNVASVVVYNTTNDYLISAGNYTVFTDGIIVNDSNSDNLSEYAWQVSYTHTDGGEACVATNTMVVQFGTFPALVGLIGTIIFLGIVIGVLVSSFVFGGRRREGI